MDAVSQSARRRRAIVFAGAQESPVLGLLSALAVELSAVLRSTFTLAECHAVLSEEGEHVCLTAIEGEVVDLLAAAREVHRLAPSSELVFLATEAEEAVSRRRLGVTPRIGTHWRFADPGLASLSRILTGAFQRADQRRSTRTTLDRFNARLSAPAQNVDTRELRSLVISDRFLSSILESAFDAVLLVDRVRNVAIFNPAAERLFQKTKAQAISSPVQSLAGGSWAADSTASMLLNGAERLIQSSIVVEGQVRHIEISAAPVFDEAGNLAATSLIVRDTTERVLSEDALRTSEKLAAVGRLASSIAHEINNPLESVTNLLYLVRSSTNLDEIQEYADTAERELRRVSLITNQTLRFHKQSTSPTLQFCSDLIGDSLSIYQGRIVNSNVDVKKRKRAMQPVTCFGGEIRQILSNLIGNAIDAMPTGGRLFVRSREGTNWKTGVKGLVLTVADTGTGMSAATQKKIFQPFFTTKGIGGTGLGLWISCEIVGRHQGSLRVRSSQREDASGTVFTLFLPFEAVQR